MVALVASAAWAGDPEVDVRLGIEEQVLFAELGGTPPNGASPLGAVAAIRLPDPQPEPKALREAGLVGPDGRLTERGTQAWRALATPEAAFQVRRFSGRGLACVWYLVDGERMWGFSPLAEGEVRIFGPLPSADAEASIARRLAITPATAKAEAEGAFAVVDWVLLRCLSREEESLGAEEVGGSDGGSDGGPLTVDEVALAAPSARVLRALAADPAADLEGTFRALSDGARVRERLDALARDGWVAQERTDRGPGYRLDAKGKALVDEAMRPAEQLQVEVRRGARAAGFLVSIGDTSIVLVAFDAGKREFRVTPLAAGDPTQAVAEALAAAFKAAGAEAPRVEGPLLGDAIREELSRGVTRAPTAPRRRVWGRDADDWSGTDVDGDGRLDVEYEDSDGDGQADFARVRDFAGGPFTRSFVLVGDAWQESNIVEAFLEVDFQLPWAADAYHPHNVDVVLNGKVVAQLTDTVPKGLYRFPVRAQDLKVSADVASANEVRLETTHLRGGHYVVSSGIRLVVRMSQVSRYVVASDQAEAEKVLRERTRLVTSGVDPAVYANDWSASPAAPEAGKGVTVGGWVRNLGMEPAEGVKVAFFDGDPAAGGTRFEEKALEPIEAGGAARVEGTWTATPGEHRIFVRLTMPEGAKELAPANDGIDLVVRTGGDKEPPALIVMEPAEGAAAAAGEVTLRGSAKDDVGIAAIEVSVDGGLWQAVEVKERWEARVTLAKGEHRVRVRARDTSGGIAEATRVIEAR